MTPEQLIKVLAQFERCDSQEVTWRVTSRPYKMFANCSDLFYWATADLEPIENDEDIALLTECADTLLKIEADPRGNGDDAVATAWLQLFLDCGPERDPKTEG